MMQFLKDFARELIVSGVLISILLAIRYTLVRRFLTQEQLAGEVRRRLIVNTRNLTLLVLVLALIVIWGRELQTIALSLFAIAAALVLATKELIMCISGAFARSGMFSVGDRILIGDDRGDVIDKSLLTTRLLEIGPGQAAHQYTGRVLVVPNSRLFTETVVNETALGDYLTHVICIPLKTTDDWKSARGILLRAGIEACADYVKRADQWLRRPETEAGYYTPSAEPRVSVSMPEPERIDLLLRLPVPKGRKHRIEQKVLNLFLDRFPLKPDEDGTNPRVSAKTSFRVKPDASSRTEAAKPDMAKPDVAKPDAAPAESPKPAS